MDTQHAIFSNSMVAATGCPKAGVNLEQFNALGLHALWLNALGSSTRRFKTLWFKTLWFNTGTQCGLACKNHYIDFSPTNDSLAFIRLTQAQQFPNQIQRHELGTEEIGLTCGEAFCNPDIIAIMGTILRRGFRLLVLTNAMHSMLERKNGLLALHKLYGQQLTLRVSMGHFEQQLYQQRRGPNAWQPVLDGLCWLSGQGFTIAVAGRRLKGEEEQILRQGYAELFRRHNIQLDAFDQRALLLLPEITADCASECA
ncbi:MAG: radical SAM protein [Porticoccaceae bacterium]|jgi:MoaA/NifB/PqqE/SkfB family radical SAM enzyme|nr:radical SAM protein [Porticoccaceae bacterium]